ncbi:hypothetical protein LJC14_01935 [Treponema sp. OttesenSCG-928-L16]|nr:hypothetical protein [Treponema sp. OttesenSCG-928-L16]
MHKLIFLSFLFVLVFSCASVPSDGPNVSAAIKNETTADIILESVSEEYTGADPITFPFTLMPRDNLILESAGGGLFEFSFLHKNLFYRAEPVSIDDHGGYIVEFTEEEGITVGQLYADNQVRQVLNFVVSPIKK